MQTESIGWEIDDILFTATAPPTEPSRLAISCKSNEQVTASGLPAEFVKRCWQQWVRPEPNPMRRGNDRLALMTRGRNNAFMATWSELKKDAPGADLALAIGRMRATAKHRAIFDSVKNPASELGVTATDADVVAMIDSLAVVPFDFHIAESESEKAAVSQSRTLLENGSLAEGERFWNELVNRAKNVRLGTGTLDIADLWRQLRVEFQLKDQPDFAPSWQRLRALTEDYKATIETALSTGVALDRSGEIDELVATITADAECVIFGESGSGKSALVKATLEERFAGAAQVWFGPDTLDPALNEATRAGLGIGQPLGRVLDATAHTENFLVIDAAERLGRDCVLKAKALIAELARKNTPGMKPAWRVLIVAQTDAWISGTVHALAGAAVPTNFAVKALPEAVVKQVLGTTSGLEWLATHGDAVSALTNLRTLGWVIQAAARFQNSGDRMSLTDIAERLWVHWTDNKARVQWLLVRLAEREAAFEHSFALSQLDGSEVSALDELPTACPLRKDDGRVRFQHDLAADWARFQRLKEIKDKTGQWAVLAANPFWHGALRMLAQLLLRQKVGSRSAWDVAFEAAEKNRDAVPLADEVLLDALFLDPNAETFLSGRAEMLLENDGARLMRLVKRFEHVATAAGASAEMFNRFRDLSLYIEAQFRTPIYGRWPAMARFLANHRGRIAKLASPAIAGLCDRWLTSTPPVLGNGAPMPYRREFAEMALASAREMQLTHAKGIAVWGEGEMLLYQAAFAGALDLPSDVAQWALEMARRRPARADIVEQVNAYRIEQAKEHAERLERDPEYRTRHQRKMSLPPPIGFSSKRLPPWPLGPKGRIDRRFREAVLRSVRFQSLMRVDPAVAGEVLLACIIDDEPELEYGSPRDLEQELSIEFDNDGYPTAPWKSPFYAFLQINAEAALGYLNQLVNFSTGRWVETVRRGDGSDPVTLSLRLHDGTPREYAGNYWVFTWSHQDSHFVGQLYSALAALERWLCDLIDAGKDISPQIDNLLRTSNSVAVLGVLVNVGKRQPELFKEPLRPLLAVQRIYGWDYHRAKDSQYSFDAMTWARSGEVIFEMAKNWALAPYRKQMLRGLVSEMVVADRDIGEAVVAASSQWVPPTTEKEVLEFRIMVAELDYRNYTAAVDPATGKQVSAFAYPEDVAADIAAFQQDKARLNQALMFPAQCRKVLSSSYRLNEKEAEAVTSLMTALAGAEEIDLKDDMKRAPLLAAAVLLLLRAPDWLANHTAVEQQARSILDAALGEVTDDNRGPRGLLAPSHLEFAAYLAAEHWIAEPSKENDERVMRLLTGGDDVAVQVFIGLAYRHRVALGDRWWRLLFLALLRSGLSMLAPRYADEEEDGIRWRRWRRWLRTRSLSVGNSTLDSIQPLAVAQRVERFELKQWQRRYARDGRTFHHEDGRHLSGSLDTHFLARAFGWLFRDQSNRTIDPDELECHRKLVKALWAHQAWWQSGSGKDEDDDYKPMHQFGYTVLNEAARLILDSSDTAGPELWQPVFALGPKGHYAISHFLNCWFMLVTESIDAAEFGKRWRPMIEAMVLSQKWEKDRPWYHGQQLERQVLGFGSSTFLDRAKDATALIKSMQDLYEAWAKKRLTSDEDNLAGFCGFLGTKVGASLRMDGLRWIEEAMKAKPQIGKWYRERTSNAFMEFLDVLVLEHTAELSSDEKSRRALLDLVAYAVSRNMPAAQALQERIIRFF
jgi:hypothetical protein